MGLACRVFVELLGTGMDTQDTSPSVLLFFDKERFIFNAGEYESQLGSHPIASGFHEILIVSGELGYEIQIREAVVRPNCLTILRFKGGAGPGIFRLEEINGRGRAGPWPGLSRT
ncbi:PREDICTED: zinc phosphodiesterase [Prunus dulcis]|uniref:PREDICTED: zinc phosphodiesterase n=1 Tax=Prunus dulcis TaxID=3755 RepID=A0A5E4EZW9_PRUDU|nr:PREDICTED: zinc phosphodiesterase [Prunus dulcis]